MDAPLNMNQNRSFIHIGTGALSSERTFNEAAIADPIAPL
jgi:hypothetical protein